MSSGPHIETSAFQVDADEPKGLGVPRRRGEEFVSELERRMSFRGF